VSRRTDGTAWALDRDPGLDKQVWNEVLLGNGTPLSNVTSGWVTINKSGCARVSDGGGMVYCWKSKYSDGTAINGKGELGDGTTAEPAGSAAQPVLTSEGGAPFTGLVSVSGQYVTTGIAHSCAVTADAEVVCWGSGTNAQLGNGALLNSSSPVYVKTGAGTKLAGIKSVSVGKTHSCATALDGTAWCWGSDGNQGALGSPGGQLVYATKVGALLNSVEDIQAGSSETCARLNDGTVRCFGAGFPAMPTALPSSDGGPAVDHVMAVGMDGEGCVLMLEDGSLWQATNATSGIQPYVVGGMAILDAATLVQNFLAPVILRKNGQIIQSAKEVPPLPCP
jgi:hypothetical protein